MRTPATRFLGLGGVAKGPPVCACGLPSQFRRAAVSIAANIAEGFKKRGAGVGHARPLPGSVQAHQVPLWEAYARTILDSDS